MFQAMQVAAGAIGGPADTDRDDADFARLPADHGFALAATTLVGRASAPATRTGPRGWATQPQAGGTYMGLVTVFPGGNRTVAIPLFVIFRSNAARSSRSAARWLWVPAGYQILTASTSAPASACAARATCGYRQVAITFLSWRFRALTHMFTFAPGQGWVISCRSSVRHGRRLGGCAGLHLYSRQPHLPALALGGVAPDRPAVIWQRNTTGAITGDPSQSGGVS